MTITSVPPPSPAIPPARLWRRGALATVSVAVLVFAALAWSRSIFTGAADAGVVPSEPSWRCAEESTIALDATACTIPGTDAYDLCTAGFRAGTTLCALATHAALPASAKPFLADLRAKAGDVLVVSGDSMARQTLLGVVALLRYGPRAAFDRIIAAEHYFHCDAVYRVHANFTDELVVSRSGLCREGASNPLTSIDWLRSTVKEQQQSATTLLLTVVLVWTQQETMGSRVADALELVAAQRPAPRFVHVYVPSYWWSPGQVQMAQRVANHSAGAGHLRTVLVLPPTDVPNVAGRVTRGLRARNAALRGSVWSPLTRVADREHAVKGRCDGVHYQCILVPHVGIGAPQRLRAPCESCNLSALVDHTTAILALL
jgi:hypothetical protein